MIDHENEIVWNVVDVINYGVPLERKARVGMLPKLGVIQVYTDHNPPHFHIVGEKINLKFEIETLYQIDGECLNSKQIKNLKKWYFEGGGKKKIISEWNERNPDNILKF